MVSVGWTHNYSSSVGITLKPKIMTSTDVHGNRSVITGFKSHDGRVGFNVDPGSVKFGRFRDPRAVLRNHLRNRVDVDLDSGASRRHPVPSSTGGQVTAKGMTYDEIKIRLRGTGQLFEDPDFPADGSSLFYSMSAPRGIEWKRPQEICSNPKFIVGGASRFDVRQGELGDCWLLAAVANLSLYEDLLQQVVPFDQAFDRDYCGVFHFIFWRFGEWVEVVVDDRLPTRNGNLIFMHSVDRDEFWSALLEKAYAKLFGSYESLRGGSTIEALEDFTGGLAEYYDLRGKQPADLFKILTKSYAHQTLMACSISPDPNIMEAEQPNGLIRGHAYSITKIAQVNSSSGPVQLLRIRNPWGNEAEWKGRWSDSSPEWRTVSESQRRELGLSIEADGEFWMCYEDFVKEFEKLEMCALGPQSLSMDDSRKKVPFEMTIIHGGWQPGVNAGGCRNFLDTFWTNPQYRVQVEDADDDDDENLGTLIVGLMQKDRRKMRKQGAELLTIGFMIYALKEPHEGPLDMNFFKYNSAVARSPAFINTREVTGRYRLPPGTYVIVPSTFAKNERADFLLRIFSEKANPTEQMDDSVGVEEPEPAVPAKTGMLMPEPISESQVVALKKAFEKVCGPDGEITADELIDILNVAFTKELNEGREDSTKAPAPAPVPVTVRATSRGFSLLCCGLGQKSEKNSAENGSSGAKAGLEAGDHDFTFDGFSIEACRSLISMLDVDRSGSLDFEEFKILWEILRFWKAVFKKFDADNSGTMSTFELRNALNCAGYHIDNATLTSVVLRFSNRDRILRFNDYVICCARLRTAFETMRTGDSFGGAQLLNILLYL